MLWLLGVERLPAPRVAFGLVSPIVATIIGWVLLDEVLSTLQLVGLVLALESLVAARLCVTLLQWPFPEPDATSSWCRSPCA